MYLKLLILYQARPTQFLFLDHCYIFQPLFLFSINGLYFYSLASIIQVVSCDLNFTNFCYLMLQRYYQVFSQSVRYVHYGLFSYSQTIWHFLVGSWLNTGSAYLNFFTSTITCAQNCSESHNVKFKSYISVHFVDLSYFLHHRFRDANYP